MASNPRERFLLVLLPTIVVSVVWFGWMRSGYAKKYDDAKKGLVTAKATAPSETMLAEIRTKKNAAAEKDTAETKRREEALQRWQSLRKQIESEEPSASVVQRLSSLLESHELTILSHERMENAELPRSFSKLTEKIQTTYEWEKAAAAPIDPRAAPQVPATPTNRPTTTTSPDARRLALWRIELSGPYSNMQSALRELSERLPQVITVQVAMAEAKSNLTLRRWTVLIAL